MLQDKFEWSERNKVKGACILDSIDRQLNKQWKGWRCRLHKYFIEKGETDPEEAQKYRHKQVLLKANWDWLCDYWSTEEYMVIYVNNHSFFTISLELRRQNQQPTLRIVQIRRNQVFRKLNPLHLTCLTRYFILLCWFPCGYYIK